MPKKFRTDHEWITLLSSRRVNESMGAFSKRIGVGYTQVYGVVKRYPEVTKQPAWMSAKIAAKMPKAPKPAADAPPKRRGRPPGPRALVPVKAVKATVKDSKEEIQTAEVAFFRAMTMALKSGKTMHLTLRIV